MSMLLNHSTPQLREATKPRNSRGTQQEKDVRWDTKRGLTFWGELTPVQLQIYSKLPQVGAMAHFLQSLATDMSALIFLCCHMLVLAPTNPGALESLCSSLMGCHNFYKDCLPLAL